MSEQSGRANRAAARNLRRSEENKDNQSDEISNAGSDSEDAIAYVRPVNIKFKGKLNGKASYDFWDQQLKSWAYAKGKAYYDMYKLGVNETDATKDPPGNDDDDDWNTAARREMWGAIFASLSQAEAKKIKTIGLGKVEQLIRAFKKLYNATSDVKYSSLLNSLDSFALTNAPDLDSYVAKHEEIHMELAKYNEALDTRKKLHYLIKGLPSEYNPATTALTLPNSNYDWEEAKDYLKLFLERNKNVPGKSKDRSSSRVFFTGDTSNSSEMCRKFARGKCNKGDDCNYSHVKGAKQGKKSDKKKQQEQSTGGKCFSCGLTGHQIKDCKVPCSFCGKTGHGESHCNAKKKASAAFKAAKERVHATDSTKQVEGATAASVSDVSHFTVQVDDVDIPISFEGCFHVNDDGDPGSGFDIFVPEVDFDFDYHLDFDTAEEVLCHNADPDHINAQKVTPPSGALGQNVGIGAFTFLPKRLNFLAQVPSILFASLFIFFVLFGLFFPDLSGTDLSAQLLPSDDYVNVTYTSRGHGTLPANVTVLDGASTCTVITNPSKCTNVRKADVRVHVGANTLHCTQVGDVYFSQTTLNGDVPGILVKDARIIPNFGINVLTENVFLDQNASIVKQPDPITKRIQMHVTAADGDCLVRCQRHVSGLFLLFPSDSCSCTLDMCNSFAHNCAYHTASDFVNAVQHTDEKDILMQWHRRLGHRNFRDVAQFLHARGIPFKPPAKPLFCETCVQAKSSRHPLRHNPLPRLRAPRPGYTLHSDMCGPFKHPTRGGGYVYFNILVDDYSGKIWCALMNQQSEFFDHLKAVIAEIESEMGHDKVVAHLHSDAATYFEKDKKLSDYCKTKGIRQTFSPPGTPALNSVAERTIRTICEMARACMIQAAVPATLWGEAVNHSVFVLNNLPYKTGSIATRNSLFYNKPPPTRPPTRAVPFGCAAWAKVEPDGKSIGASKGLLCIVMGWDERRGSWRLCRRDDYSHLKFSGHVTINMDKFPCREDERKDDASAEGVHEFMTENRQCQVPVTPDPDEPPLSIAATREKRVITPSAQALRNLVGGDSVHTTISHGSYFTDLDDWTAVTNTFEDWDLPSHDDFAFNLLDEYALATVTRSDPADWTAAMKEAEVERQKWLAGGKQETDRIKKNESFGKWLPVKDLPPKTKLVRMGDVLKRKRNDEHKGRVVIKGFTMQPGVHFNETFAPTVVIATFRILLAMGAMHDWDIWQGDAPSAFMQPKIDAEIYVTPTPMMRHFDKELQALEAIHGRGKVAAKVLKGMPGIPQGSRLWNLHMHKILTSLKFSRSQVDYGLYYIHGHQIFLLLWVDDIFLFVGRDDRKRADDIWSALRKAIGIGEKAPIEDCLGVDIKRDRANKRLFISQEKAILKLRDKLGLPDITGAAATPMDPKVKLTKADCPTAEEAATMADEQSRYRSVVASLIYFSLWCRPDISFAVSALARFMHNPGATHQTALKRVLRYLFANASLGLHFDFSNSPKREGVYGFYDASFADCPDTRRSTVGFVLYWWGCAVNWISKLHRCVTTSTNHSEYVAGAACARECAFEENLARELRTSVAPIALFSDSQGCIAQSYNPSNRAATKHVDVADHYIREQVERKHVTVSYVDTKNMDADIFTKPLDKAAFLRHRDKMLTSPPF
jgi:transposase InsO family protein